MTSHTGEMGDEDTQYLTCNLLTTWNRTFS